MLALWRYVNSIVGCSTSCCCARSYRSYGRLWLLPAGRLRFPGRCVPRSGSDSFVPCKLKTSLDDCFSRSGTLPTIAIEWRTTLSTWRCCSLLPLTPNCES